MSRKLLTVLTLCTLARPASSDPTDEGPSVADRKAHELALEIKYMTSLSGETPHLHSPQWRRAELSALDIDTRAGLALLLTERQVPDPDLIGERVAAMHAAAVDDADADEFGLNDGASAAAPPAPTRPGLVVVQDVVDALRIWRPTFLEMPFGRVRGDEAQVQAMGDAITDFGTQHGEAARRGEVDLFVIAFASPTNNDPAYDRALLEARSLEVKSRLKDIGVPLGQVHVVLVDGRAHPEFFVAPSTSWYATSRPLLGPSSLPKQLPRDWVSRMGTLVMAVDRASLAMLSDPAFVQDGSWTDPPRQPPVAPPLAKVATPDRIGDDEALRQALPICETALALGLEMRFGAASVAPGRVQMVEAIPTKETSELAFSVQLEARELPEQTLYFSIHDTVAIRQAPLRAVLGMPPLDRPVAEIPRDELVELHVGVQQRAVVGGVPDLPVRGSSLPVLGEMRRAADATTASGQRLPSELLFWSTRWPSLVTEVREVVAVSLRRVFAPRRGRGDRAIAAELAEAQRFQSMAAPMWRAQAVGLAPLAVVEDVATRELRLQPRLPDLGASDLDAALFDQEQADQLLALEGEASRLDALAHFDSARESRCLVAVGHYLRDSSW